MYRTVAVFLWTLNGCPVRMIRFAITRVVSGFRKVPVATSCGADGQKILVSGPRIEANT